MNGLRSALYLIARLLGDINAVLRGRVLERIGRSFLLRSIGGAIGRLFR